MLSRSRRALTALGLTLAFTSNAIAQPISTIWHVDADAPDDANQDGLTWEHAFTVLQDALDATDPNDQIWVASGTYYPTALYGGVTSRHATFHIPRARRVYGGFLGHNPANPNDPGETLLTQRNPEVNLTILDGDINIQVDPNDPNELRQALAPLDNSYHVVYFQDAPPEVFTKLSGFVIQNGRADFYYDPIPEDPDDAMGGGVFLKYQPGGATSPLLDRLVIRNNYAIWQGGGLSMASKQPLHIANCRFENNTVEGMKGVTGGAGKGGGACAEKHGATIVQMQNCIFWKNRVVLGSGGGLWGKATVVNCTFDDNRVDEDPNGVFGGAYFARRSVVHGIYSGNLDNCIVWDHQARAIHGPYVTYSDIEDDVDPAYWSNDGGNIQADPIFRFPEAGDFRLRGDSPCIDVADNDKILSDHTDVNDDGVQQPTIPWDLQKFDRVLNTIVEMGPYEVLECPGDVDGDGDADLTDLSILLTCYGLGQCGSVAGCCRADLDFDGDVDLTDLSILLTNFGTNCREGMGGFAFGSDSMNAGDDPLTDWLRSATPQEVLDWWNAGMPPIGGGEDQ